MEGANQKVGCFSILLGIVAFIVMMIIGFDIGPVMGTTMWLLIFFGGWLATRGNDSREFSNSELKNIDSYYPKNNKKVIETDKNQVLNKEKKAIVSNEIEENLKELDDNSLQVKGEVELIDSIKRIGYNPSGKFNQKNPYEYPVAKMPLVGSVIKSARLGKVNRKGSTEEYFHKFLLKYFSAEFNILINSFVPINSSNAFEPDFVLSSKNSKDNIFIDLEIDEPYEGVNDSPNPIHVVNSDLERDNFFNDRGWIVIRFAEIQIFLEPEKCCAYLASILQEISSVYKIPVELQNLKSIKEIPQWNEKQSRYWAEIKYRENYLGINRFEKVEVLPVKHDIILSEADVMIEELYEKRNNRKPHSNTFEQNVGNLMNLLSVSELIDKFNSKHDSKIKIDVLPDQDEKVKEEYLITQINNFHIGNNYDSSLNEFKYFQTFIGDYPSLKPLQSEWLIFDEELLVSAIVPMTYIKKDDSIFLFSWKSNIPIRNNSIKLESVEYKKSCLELNFCRYILEARYNQSISSMNLLFLNSKLESYQLLTVPNMEEEVKEMLSTYKSWLEIRKSMGF